MAKHEERRALTFLALGLGIVSLTAALAFLAGSSMLNSIHYGP